MLIAIDEDRLKRLDDTLESIVKIAQRCEYLERTRPMNREEVKAYLGGIAERTLQTYLSRGLPMRGKGKDALFLRHEVDEWNEARYVRRHLP